MISVIITTFGGDSKLRRAIASVLNQTYTDVEVIVVDDNDPKSEARAKTESIMQQYECDARVVYLKHRHNMNGAAARNTGIKEARGSYIAFLDDDDYFFQNRLEKLVTVLDSDSSLAGAYTAVLMSNAGYIVSSVRSDTEYLDQKTLLLNQNALGTGSNIFLRSSVVKTHNGFDTDFDRYQDVEFMLRVTANDKVKYIDYPLVIKDISNARQPKYRKVKKSLDTFCTKFKSEIAGLAEDEQSLFWDDRLTGLFALARYGLSSSDMSDAAEILSSFRKLKAKERLITNLYSVYSVFLKMKYYVVSHGYEMIQRMKEIKYKKIHNRYKKAMYECEEISTEFYYRYL